MANDNRQAAAGRGVVLAAAVAALLAACGGSNSSPPLEIRTVNNRADLVSGGDAMVEIVLPEGADTAGLKVDVAGRDVSSAFARRSDGRVTGVITGLAKGDNVVQARADKAGAAQLTITNAIAAARCCRARRSCPSSAPRPRRRPPAARRPPPTRAA